MLCPACGVAFHMSSDAPYAEGDDVGGPWGLFWEDCPTCGVLVVGLKRGGFPGEAIYPPSLP